MDYKEMIKLGALKIELDKQYSLASKKIDKWGRDGKSFQHIQYQVLHTIKDFYRDSAAEISKKICDGIPD
jgi:hypothetical protein